jgi:hypothetical protein
MWRGVATTTECHQHCDNDNDNDNAVTWTYALFVQDRCCPVAVVFNLEQWILSKDQTATKKST